VSAVHELVPKALELHGTAETPLAKSPADSLAAMATKPGLQIDLAVAEPLVVDPVAIDWGPDGKLWVVEMLDYPMGMDGKYKPGGRIRLLEDTDGDGRYDKATVFLDNLPFPTGVMAWGKGVLICAAPDIIYAEDTKGTGHADVVRKIFTGFATDNYQARVNSLALGLDNWVHGANGLLGGVVHSANSSAGVDISGRDFRMNPETGAFEPVAGVTQQGRARDDWDNWFGCSNSAFLFQFPLPDYYVRRNPHIPAPPSRLMLPADADPSIVYPASHPLERFNSPESLNHVTSGCGLGLYRDTLLGADFSGDTFTCEPVHNLVHRLKLTPKGVAFDARRAADEQTSEFLTSKDNWFRPVQVRTGPDGALWVVDMYRFVIEHPRWIPPDMLAKLDVRAGADKGRIYRIYPKGAKLRPIRDLTKLATPELVSALETPNGTMRDLVQMELLHRADTAANEPLVNIFHTSQLPAVRLQALCTLDGLHALTPELLEQALADANPTVRRHAVRLSENLLAKSPDVAAACLKLVSDPDIGVRYQLALSLGEWNNEQATRALGAIACTAPDDTWLRAAVLSSSAHQPLEVLKATLAAPGNTGDRGELAGDLIATAAGTAARIEDLGQLLTVIAPASGAKIENWQVIGLLHWQDAMDRRKAQVTDFLNSSDPAVRAAAKEMKRVYVAAHSLAGDAKADEALRAAAIRLFGRGLNDPQKDLPQLAAHLDPAAPLPFQRAALDTLARSRSDQAPDILLGGWARHGPAMRIAIIGTLLSRDEWTGGLLSAVEKGVVASSDIPTASRERLAKHTSESIRKRAMALLPNRPSDRAAVVAKYQVVADLQAHAEKGATVFKNICSVCHNYLGQGQEVGPNVTTFRNKSVQDFLIAILDPNAAVEPRYTAYSVQTKDGRSLYGVISSESATTLVITQPGGVRETILRSDIATLTSSARSLMPEGLEQAISPQELADLIAYLKGGG
jgi:putative membrane-bound dehydrogenase-like protein